MFTRFLHRATGCDPAPAEPYHQYGDDFSKVTVVQSLTDCFPHETNRPVHIRKLPTNKVFSPNSDLVSTSTLVNNEGETAGPRCPAGFGTETDFGGSTVAPSESISNMAKYYQSPSFGRKPPAKTIKVPFLNLTLTIQRPRKRQTIPDERDAKVTGSPGSTFSLDNRTKNCVSVAFMKPNSLREVRAELPDHLFSQEELTDPWAGYYDLTGHHITAELPEFGNDKADGFFAVHEMGEGIAHEMEADTDSSPFAGSSTILSSVSAYVPTEWSAGRERRILGSGCGSSEQLYFPDETATVEWSDARTSTDADSDGVTTDFQHASYRSGYPDDEAFSYTDSVEQLDVIELHCKGSIESSPTVRDQEPPEALHYLYAASSSEGCDTLGVLGLAKLAIALPGSVTINDESLTPSSAASPSPTDTSPISTTVSSAPTSAPVSPSLASPCSSIELVFDEQEEEDRLRRVEAVVDKELLPKILETLLKLSTAHYEATLQGFFRRGFGIVRMHSAGTSSNGNPQASGTSTNSPSSATPNAESSGAGKKRARDDERDAEEKDRQNRRRANDTSTFAGLQPLKKLACPYHKRDPSHFGRASGNSKFRTCSSGFSTPKLLKAHLKNIHLPPHYCGRCNMVFKSDEEKTVHLKQAIRCAPYDDPEFPRCYMMSPKQQEQVLKKKSPKISEEEHWHSIWGQLFPEDALPSSIYLDHISSFQALLHVAMDQHIPEFIATNILLEPEDRHLRNLVLAITDYVLDRLADGNLAELIETASSQIRLCARCKIEKDHDRHARIVTKVGVDRTEFTGLPQLECETSSPSFEGPSPQLDLFGNFDTDDFTNSFNMDEFFINPHDAEYHAPQPSADVSPTTPDAF